MVRRLALILALVPWAGIAIAQIPDTLSSDARISLVTITPGDAVYSMYGHSAIRVTDPPAGVDLAFNYGTFDFSQPWFVARFAYGRLEYYLSVSTVRDALRGADLEHRTVVEQVLDLRRSERDSLYAFLLWNLRPENRRYRYDFFFDNCATRIRDLFEQRLGTTVIWTGDPAGGRTLRELLQPYARDRQWLGTGIDLGLGSSTDRPATVREAAFLPDLLAALVAGAVIGTGDETRPLAAAPPDTVFVPDVHPPAEVPRPWPAWSGWFALLVVAGVTWRERRRRHSSQPVEAVDRLVFGLAGTAGLVLGFLVFISEHAVTAPNWNLLWAAPTHVLIAFMPGRAPRNAVTVYYALAAVGAAAVFPAAALFQSLPAIAFPLAAVVVLRSVRGVLVARQRPPIEW
jgi:hypothetical protein